jgi:hypothetical protein
VLLGLRGGRQERRGTERGVSDLFRFGLYR